MCEGPRGAREAEHESFGDLARLVSNAQASHLPLQKVRGQTFHPDDEFLIFFSVHTFLRRKGRFSLRNRPVNVAIMMLQYSGTAKLKVEE